jgi:hypothetical protein
MATENLNVIVENVLLHFEDSNLGSEQARKTIASAIVDAIMIQLEGETDIEMCECVNHCIDFDSFYDEVNPEQSNEDFKN